MNEWIMVGLLFPAVMSIAVVAAHRWWYVRLEQEHADMYLVIDTARFLEAQLETNGHAGVSLHERISTVEASGISSQYVREFRFLATVRNRMAHEPGYRLDSRARRRMRVVRELVHQLGRTK